jgi:hypothetical protein
MIQLTEHEQKELNDYLKEYSERNAETLKRWYPNISREEREALLSRQIKRERARFRARLIDRRRRMEIKNNRTKTKAQMARCNAISEVIRHTMTLLEVKDELPNESPEERLLRVIFDSPYGKIPTDEFDKFQFDVEQMAKNLVTRFYNDNKGEK